MEEDVRGFFAPVHRALTEPILLGGAPRTVAIANGTLAGAVGLGLRLWLAGLVICAIDNEPRILDGMRTLLAGWGCAVVTAATRAEAIAELEAQGLRPDAAVVDYHLDADNGVDVIAALRAHFGGDLPAVLVTADRTEELRAEAAACEIRVLAKPLKPAALRSLLAQWRVTRSAAE